MSSHGGGDVPGLAAGRLWAASHFPYLASGLFGAQVLANLRDRLYPRDSILPKLALERRKILMQQIEDFFPVNDRRRAQPSVLPCALCA